MELYTLSARSAGGPGAVDPKCANTGSPAGETLQDHREDTTCFIEPSEGEVVYRGFDIPDCARPRGRTGRQWLLGSFSNSFTESGHYIEWMSVEIQTARQT